MYGKTFSGNANEFGFALDHIEDLTRNEATHSVRARVQGVSTITGGHVNIEGEIISVVRHAHPGVFVHALVFHTPNRVFTVGGALATKEDIAAESITILSR